MTAVPVVRIGNALVAALQEDIEDRSALEGIITEGFEGMHG